MLVSASGPTYIWFEGYRSPTYMNDEDGILLENVEFISERWVRWVHTLLNAKSPKLDPSIPDGLDQWPDNTQLIVQSTTQELTDAIY